MNAPAAALDATELPQDALEDEATRRGTSDQSLVTSFAIASLVVIVGVLASWVAVKRAGTDDGAIAADLTMDDLPTAVMEETGASGSSLVERGDVSFAAGRVIEPRFDNALYFYRSALQQNENDTRALAGLERVELWLDGQLASALAAQQFARANTFAGIMMDLRPDDVALAARMDGISRIQGLLSQGAERLRGRDYVAAAATFRELISIDASNIQAREGLRSAVDALVNAGMSAANEGDLDTARARLADARGADSSAPGIATLADRIETVGSAPVMAGPEEMVAQARASIAAGQLFGADSDDAFAVIAAISRGWPGDPIIAELRREAQAGLVSAGRSALASNDLDGMRRVIGRAEELGMDQSLFGDLGTELAYRSYMADFEAERWRVRLISELTPVAQRSPELSRRASRLSGYVDVEFTIDTEGRVQNEIVTASTAGGLEEPSLEAIRGWRFEPVSVGGRPVPARAAMRFSFVN